MKPHRPSGESGPGGGASLFVVVVVVGAAAGGLIHLVSNWIRLIIIFPALMGAAVGIAGTMIAKSKSIRAPIMAGVLGFFGGLVAWTTDLVISYESHRSALAEELETFTADIQTELGIAPESLDVERAIDILLVAWARGHEPNDIEIYQALTGEAPVEGEPLAEPGLGEAFAAWVDLQAQAGTSITRASSSGSALELGETGTYLLWLFEIVVAGGLAAGLLVSQARQPFCERCKVWYPDSPGAMPLAGVESKDAVLRALDTGDADGLVALAGEEYLRSAHLALSFRRCPKCESAPVHVRLLRVKLTRGKKEEKALRDGLIDATIYTQFAARMQEQAAAEADTETAETAET